MPTYLLAINCGSSSIKAKLYEVPADKAEPLADVASLNVSNINAKGEKVKIKVAWAEGVDGKDVDEEGEDGDKVERTHKKGIMVTKDHTEGLTDMDKLSDFAPLHQTIPVETYTYALPPSPIDQPMPLRKYGFHGLSYASIVDSLAKHLNKEPSAINVVVAHLGSGASACCIRNGKSIDTSMGLTPLEGLIGGTRCGTIDPTAIFHHTPDAAADSGMEGMKVTNAEMIMNKKSGLQALAGTTNFGTITERMGDSDEARLAYNVFLDRLLGYVSQYLCKLLATTKDIDGIVFSGGIGEKSQQLRADVLEHFAWMGVTVKAGGDGVVEEIANGKLRGWVVKTDEEGWCARLARDDFDI